LERACEQGAEKLTVNIISAGSGFAVLSVAGSRLCGSVRLLVEVLPAQSSAETTPRSLLLRKRVLKCGYFQR